MTFLSPILLTGLALASVPVIIHLLNRRRFTVVDWAPMKYLKLTIKSNRRRLRIEQLILLAVRTLIVLAIILAVARPMLAGGGAARWLAGTTRTSRVIVVDNSLSMGYREGGRPALDLAKQAGREILSAVGGQDTVTLLAACGSPEPIVKDAPMTDAQRLSGLVDSVPLLDSRCDWPTVLQRADDALASATFSAKEVILITDGRKSGWGGDLTALAQKWENAGIALRIIDVGSRSTENTVVAALRQDDPVALPGEPLRLTAQLRNDTAQSIAGQQATLTVGDDARPILLPELPAGRTTDVPLTLTPRTPGQVSVRLSLPSDSLPADDARFFIANVRDALNLTLVDGEPSAQPFESETDFLTLAFSVGATPWRTTRKTDGEWNAQPGDAPDVLAIANVAQLSAERCAQIEHQVRDGMGLMIFVGDQIDSAAWNQRLWRDGDGLLPGRFDGVIDVPVTGLVIEPQSNSPLESMAKLAPAALARVASKKHLALTLPTTSTQSRVLARWNNSESSPAIIEKKFGRGRVILFTTAADKAWGEWPLDPTYVLAVRSAAIAIARDSSGADNVSAGEPIRFALAPGQKALEPKVTPPGQFNSIAEFVESNATSPTIRVARTDVAGLYKLDWKDVQGKPQSHTAAASADVVESDLTVLADGELESLLTPLSPTIVRYTGTDSLTERGREIWRSLALAGLTLLVVETALATWVGRER